MSCTIIMLQPKPPMSCYEGRRIVGGFDGLKVEARRGSFDHPGKAEEGIAPVLEVRSISMLTVVYETCL